MSSGDIQTPYSAADVIVVVGDVIVTGFGEGDFITASYEEDRFMHKAGADGEVGIAKNPNRMGSIEITVSSTSRANAELSDLFNLGSLGDNLVIVPVRVTDLSSNAIISASRCWLGVTPDFTFGKEITERTWTIRASDLTFGF